MPYALGPTSNSLLNQPYGGTSPFAPAGTPDLTRQGWATQLQGLAGQQATANQWSNTLGGYNPGIGVGGAQLGQGGGQPLGLATPEQVQGIGASFNPMNPYLRGEIGAANKQITDQFDQYTMPEMNRNLAGAGSGAYGGTRAGITQGLATQGMMDAVQQNTTDMTSRGYNEGLNRYVQDRASSLGALNTERGQYRNAFGQYRGQDVAHAGNIMGAQAGNNANQLQAMMAASNLAQQGAGYGTQMGTHMAGFGNQQQGQNQRVQDWYNSQYNHAQGYPGQQFGQWTNNMQQVTGPGVQGGMQQNVQGTTPNMTNPVMGAVGGGMAGYGAYNSFAGQPNNNNYQGYTPNQYRTWM